MPLSDLVRSDDAIANYPCPIGTAPILDSIESVDFDEHKRKIPKIIHITSKTRCATAEVIENVNKW